MTNIATLELVKMIGINYLLNKYKDNVVSIDYQDVDQFIRNMFNSICNRAYDENQNSQFAFCNTTIILKKEVEIQDRYPFSYIMLKNEE